MNGYIPLQPRGPTNHETTDIGEPIKHYLWHNLSPVAQLDTISEKEKISYLHTDCLYTPSFDTNQSGAIVWCWEGEAFGEDTVNH